MVTARLTGRIGMEPILPVRRAVTISTMTKLVGDGDGDGDGSERVNTPLPLYLHFVHKVMNIFKIIIQLFHISVKSDLHF